MTTLIFFGTIVALFIFVVRGLMQAFQGKNIVSTSKSLVIIVISYSLLWSIFYGISSDKVVPFGTDICFDDWCATVLKFERPKTLGKGNQLRYPNGQFIILKIKMSNHARGIAQKPSEPRVHLEDAKGNSYSFSTEGQLALEKQNGKQIPIDERLELHQSLETQLVFDIPKEAKNVKVVIDEGPFITKLLWKEDREVFVIP